MYTKNRGFTLIELLIALVLVGILAVIAMPNLTKWIRTNQVNADAEKIASLLHYARSEAVNLRKIVYVCPARIRDDGKPDNYCNPDYYSSGMAVILNTNPNPDNGDRLRTINLDSRRNDIRVKTHSATGETLDGVGSEISIPNHIWAYFPDGSFKTTYKTSIDSNTFRDQAPVYTKITITNKENAALALKLIILPNGRVYRCTKVSVTDPRTQIEIRDVDISDAAKQNMC